MKFDMFYTDTCIKHTAWLQKMYVHIHIVLDILHFINHYTPPTVHMYVHNLSVHPTH